MGEDLLIRSLAKTGNLVSGTIAVHVADQIIEKTLLPLGTIDGQWATGDTNGSTEETLIVALVGYEVGSHRPRSCRFTHDSDLAGVTSKGRDVLLDPPEGHALIFETQIEQTGLLEFPRGSEAKVVEAVVDGCEQNGLALFDGSLDDICSLVEQTRQGGLT